MCPSSDVSLGVHGVKHIGFVNKESDKLIIRRGRMGKKDILGETYTKAPRVSISPTLMCKAQMRLWVFFGAIQFHQQSYVQFC
jgi:hypothetical protein